MITAAETFRSASFVVPMTNHHNHGIVRPSSSFSTTTANCHPYGYGHHTTMGMGSSMSLSAVHLSPFSSLAVSSNSEFDNFLLPDNPLGSPVAIVILAVALLVAAQSFINGMLEGDQGLGAFLSDGTGFNRSRYRPNTQRDAADADNNKDPLPWLKLPKLDFVEVAGQEEEQRQGFLDPQEEARVYEELDRLKEELAKEIQAVRRKRLEGITTVDDMAQAKRLRAKLEGLMSAYGIEYETDE